MIMRDQIERLRVVMPARPQALRRMFVQLVLAEAVEREDVGDILKVAAQIGDKISDEGDG